MRQVGDGDGTQQVVRRSAAAGDGAVVVPARAGDGLLPAVDLMLDQHLQDREGRARSAPVDVFERADEWRYAREVHAFGEVVAELELGVDAGFHAPDQLQYQVAADDERRVALFGAEARHLQRLGRGQRHRLAEPGSPAFGPTRAQRDTAAVENRGGDQAHGFSFEEVVDDAVAGAADPGQDAVWRARLDRRRAVAARQ